MSRANLAAAVALAATRDSPASSSSASASRDAAPAPAASEDSARNSAAAKSDSEAALVKALVLIAAILARVLLFWSPWQQYLANKVELVTLATSWKAVAEGYFLLAAGKSPYDGEVFNQVPLVLPLYHFLQDLPAAFTLGFFVLLDLLIAGGIYRLAMVVQRNLRSEDSLNLLSPATVALLYLWNPFSIVSCVAQSTALINNLAVVFAILFAIRARAVASMFCVALASYWSLYPLVLVVPVIMLNVHAADFKSTPKAISQVILCLASFGLWLAALLLLSFTLLNSWEFLEAYTFILLVPDLTPNIGLFWYFFIEIFEHFRLLFLCTFQLHIFLYLVPLSIKLSHNPLFLIFLMNGIVCVFKSYPSLADTALLLGLFPLFQPIFKHLRYSFLILNIFVFSFFLAPPFWYFWINQGSGNANFYYAITLVFSVGQIMLLIDSYFATLKSEHLSLNPKFAEVVMVLN